ncbi:MAG: nucleotide kinase domain-containing protein [bacterium]|jgi:hypothetical protein
MTVEKNHEPFKKPSQSVAPSRENKVRPISIGSGRVLKVTTVFDTYWRFAVKRQELFMRRIMGTPQPWTDDQILASHRFTNVYRASDRVSQYLIRHVLYEGPQSIEELFFRAILFKFFNRIGTWEELTAKLGAPSWKRFEFERYATVLDAMMARGKRIYSAAYIMPSPSFGSAWKHRNHLRLLEYMMRDGAPRRIALARSLKKVFEILRGYPSLGDFLAFQFSIDLNYSQLIDFSEMEFVVAGPGAREGIRKCFTDTAGLSERDLIRMIAERADEEFRRLGLSFQTLWGRPLQLIDCQNLFCEVDKYARMVHPEIKGKSGRTRIKQKFTPNFAPIPHWYPPKWGL